MWGTYQVCIIGPLGRVYLGRGALVSKVSFVHAQCGIKALDLIGFEPSTQSDKEAPHLHTPLE
jgi:hypothetical protein